MLLFIFLCVCFSALPLATETAEETTETPLLLPDGSYIELTASEVLRKKTPSSAPKTKSILWSIPAKEPRLPVLFENSEGQHLFLFFTQLGEHYGEFHALRVEDGEEQWKHPVWFHSRFMPVSPLWIEPWIFFGQGVWLEQMDPIDGKIIERFSARELILSLEAGTDASIDVKIELSYDYKKDITIHFQDEQFHPRLVAPANLLASMDLWKRAHWVMEDFDSYLELHRAYREPITPDVVLQRRNFNLKDAEHAYRNAYHSDPTNPSFALYLALALYYQGRQAEAERYFQEALQKSKNFWEESLRLGGFVCERLLPQWADAFYAQGMTRYFQEIPAPPEWATLIEILIHMPGQRQAAHGSSFERAMHVLQRRRQTIPYTEGDYNFSRRYIRAFRKIGQIEQIEQEAQRLEGMKLWSDFSAPTPFSFIGFLMASVLVGGILIVQNDARHPFEWGLVLLTLIAIGIVISPRGITDRWKIVLLLVLLSGYIGTMLSFRHYKGMMVFLRTHTSSLQRTFRQMVLDFSLSSYVVLLGGMHIAYLSGKLFSRSPIGGKIAELMLIVLWIGIWHWRHKKSNRANSFRHFKLVLVFWVLIWGQLAWLHYYTSTMGIEGSIPLPSIDYGHPHWENFLDERMALARFRNRNLEFMDAVNRQLAGDHDFALQVYELMIDDPRALNNLGVMSLATDPERAHSYFGQALERNPAFTPAIYNLGVLTKNPQLIEKARADEPWRVNVYQSYAPDKLWIVVPELKTWTRGAYWSQGGFFVRGWTEIVLAVEDAFFDFRHLFR